MKSTQNSKENILANKLFYRSGAYHKERIEIEQN
jgi:hypothetical protein